jgi:hypothetical protein
MACAQTSLPVPVSPMIRTPEEQPAIVGSLASSLRKAALVPTNPFNRGSISAADSLSA